MCDTFIAMPPATRDGSVIFAKNSDHPAGEGQGIRVYPRASHAPGEILKCTYMEIPEAGQTHSVLLSQIDWMWGAEMGAIAGQSSNSASLWKNGLRRFPAKWWYSV